MKRTFTASITRDGDWSFAQCLEVDIASQGETAEEALTLYFTALVAAALPDLQQVEVESGAD